MIKKLSDSWRQQKQGSSDQNHDIPFSKIKNKDNEQSIGKLQSISPVLSKKVKNHAEVWLKMFSFYFYVNFQFKSSFNFAFILSF